MVTGHYARIGQEGGRWVLKKALDRLDKDQSYVLYSLTQEQLAHTLPAAGRVCKEATRAASPKNWAFSTPDKPDSQDICFVPDGDYAAFIERTTGKTYPEGNFVDEQGNVLGCHRGIIHYTIGQRRGLGIAAETPLYVKRIDPERNEVVLCRDEALYSRALTAKELNWMAFETPPESFRASAKIRYRHTEQPCTVTALPGGRVAVEFDEPQRAATPGQAVVFYNGDTVLGGGVIE